MAFEEFLRSFGSTLTSGSLAALGIVLLAGLLASTICPCTLPVGIGIAGVAGAAEGQSRRTGFFIAAAFFAGMVVCLTLLGGLAGRLGAVLTESFGRYWSLAMAALSLAAAGLAFSGPRLRVSQLAEKRRPGIAGAFSYGFIFSLGTSAAPLVFLLTVAAAQARPGYGALLAFVFGLGRGLPFLVAGLFAGALTRLVRLGSWRRTLEVVSGLALLFVSGYYAKAFMDLL